VKLHCDRFLAYPFHLFIISSGSEIAYWLGYGLHSPGFAFWKGIFLLSRRSTPTLEPTQSHIQFVAGVPSPGVKQPRREAHHHFHIGPRIRIRGDIPLRPLYFFMSYRRTTVPFFIIPCLDVLDPVWVTNSVAKQCFVLVAAVVYLSICSTPLHVATVFSYEDWHSDWGLLRSSWGVGMCLIN
jgi:hypothetical protein